MKTKIWFFIVVPAMAIILTVMAIVVLSADPVVDESASLEEETYVVDEQDMLSETLVDTIEASELSEEETAGLLLMREEEKLARDVYLTLYDLWGLRPFSNIAASEQTHTDAVKVLLDRYDLEDPVVNDERGVFTNSTLQELYDALVAQGSVSLEEALIVGATIEDLDIFDLEALLAETDNEDIQLVYENLIRGSENHMRAFVRQLEMRGVTYEPQYISEERLNTIVGA